MQVMAGADRGGAEAFFERLVPALSRAGVEQAVVIRRNSTRKRLLEQCGIAPVELRFGGAFDLVTRRALRHETARYRPHIQLAWMSRAAKFCGTNGHVLAARLGGYYDLKYYRHCDHLIGNTRDIRDYLIRQGWPPEKSWYLPNFVDAKPAPPIDRATLGTPEDAPLLLALGRLHRNKGFEILLGALAQVPDAYLWLAGDGPLKQSLQQDAERLGIAARVRFLGWRTDIPALFAAATMLVCPSRHEPFGNVVIEAWAHRRPVVAAAAQGPGALIVDGQSGLLVPIEDANSLAIAIMRVAQAPDLAAALVAGGHAAYEKDFTESAVVDQYRDFFERVKH
jgi:glycosyltransferase involved in cell wall biosynthesis